MRTFLKVSSVLVLSFGVYYLLLGAALFMSSDQIGLMASTVDEVIDASAAAKMSQGMGVTMLLIGLMEGLAGLFGLLGGKRRGLLIASVVLGGLMQLSSVRAVLSAPFDWMLMVDLALPVLLLIPAVSVLVLDRRA